jgi:glycosyltransferase involved in cell wall biosynthesis
MYSFLANWRRWLDDQGIWHTQDVETRYNVLFVNSFMVPYGVIAKAKQNNPQLRVVQRIDGSARDYGRFDDADDQQARVNMLADITIFQSNYSRYSTTQKFKVIHQDGPVIYNPVNIQMFYPDYSQPRSKDKMKIGNASFSTARKKGTWKIGRLAQQNPDVTFVLCGRYPDLPDLSNIHLLGHLGRTELASAMRACDLFLHLAENDPCPNVVLEALASGLPVLYKNSGGTPELVGECGIPITIDSFRQQLEIAWGQRDKLSEAARARAVEHYSPDHIFPQYLDAISQGQRRPLPSIKDFVRAALLGYSVLPYRPRQMYWLVRRWLGAKIRGRA